MKKINQIPEWFKNLPDDAKLNSAELKALYGYSPRTQLSELLKRGTLPQPHETVGPPQIISIRYYWHVGKLREQIKSRMI